MKINLKSKFSKFLQLAQIYNIEMDDLLSAIGYSKARELQSNKRVVILTELPEELEFDVDYMEEISIKIDNKKIEFIAWWN